MAGYQILSTLLKEELDQLTEEGRLFDREEMASRIREAENDRDKLMRLYTEMCGLPVREDYVYTEPSEYEEILPLCQLGNTVHPVEEDKLYD